MSRAYRSVMLTCFKLIVCQSTPSYQSYGPAFIPLPTYLVIIQATNLQRNKINLCSKYRSKKHIHNMKSHCVEKEDAYIECKVDHVSCAYPSVMLKYLKMN